MSSFTIEVQARAAVQALMKAASIAPQRIDQAVQRAAIETSDKIRTDSEFPTAFGQLRNSIYPEKLEEMQWLIAPHTDYSEYVHEGTRGGGFAPFMDLLAWVKRKGIQPRNPNWSIEDLTFAIQRKILQRGTPKQPFVQKIADSGFPQNRLNALVSSAAGQILAEAGL